MNQLLNEAEFSYLKEHLLDDKEESYGPPELTNKDDSCTRKFFLNALKPIRMHQLPSDEFLDHISDHFTRQQKRVRDFIAKVKERKLPLTLNLVCNMNY